MYNKKSLDKSSDICYTIYVINLFIRASFN